MSVYVTEQGDMWDAIAYKVYGDENKIATLVEANPKYRDIFVFPAGVELTVPEIADEEKAEVSADVPIWRR